MRLTWCAATLALSATWLAGGLARAAEPELPRLGDLSAFRRVCDAVRTEGAVRFEGDEVERGRARAEFKRKRDQVLSGVYVADVPGAGFAFGEYDYESHRLPVDLSRPLRAVEGGDLLPVHTEDELEFSLAPDQAHEIVKARSAGKLKLRVSFRLAPSAELGDPCVRLGGGRTLRMRVEALALDLVPDEGRARARIESSRFREAVADFLPVSKPRVQIGKTGDLTEVALLKALEMQLLGCYKASLAKNARLRGSLVMGMELDREGRVEAAHPEIDAISDETIVGCAAEKLKAQRFPKGKPHLSLTLFFKESD
jgi:hypothetical protein